MYCNYATVEHKKDIFFRFFRERGGKSDRKKERQKCRHEMNREQRERENNLPTDRGRHRPVRQKRMSETDRYLDRHRGEDADNLDKNR